MFDLLAHYYTQFNDLATRNQVVAGAVSLWGLSVVTYLARGVPTAIINFITREITTSFEFTNAGDDGNLYRYNCLLEYISGKKGLNFSRNLKLRSVCGWGSPIAGDEKEIQPGGGRHFFILKGRLFWFVRSSLPSSGSYKDKESVLVTTFGRSHKPFHDIVEEAIPIEKDDTVRLYQYANEWMRSSTIQKRNIDTVITANQIKEQIMGNIETFFSSGDWYSSRGISWKEVIILTGPPGTGKTSLIKALASYFDLCVYEVSLHSMSDQSFRRALATIPPKSICLIEDFEASGAVRKRRNIDDHLKRIPEEVKISGPKPTIGVVEGGVKKKEDEEREKEEFSFLTLSGVLNTLDGISDLHGVLVFMTSNDLSGVDPAILRKGRTDHIYSLEWFTDKEIREYSQMVFPGIQFPEGVVFDDAPGCDVYSTFKEHRNNPLAYLQALQKHTSLEIVIKGALSLVSKIPNVHHNNLS